MSHRIFRYFLVLIFVLGLVAIPAPPAALAAGPWYVATTGDDNNDCLSPGTPCATINGAIGKASSGDIIYITGGTYVGTGNEVVLIDRDITLSGGWDASFSTQSSSSVIDGEFTRRGVTLPAFVTAVLEFFVVRNGDLMAGRSGIENNGNLTLQKTSIQNNGTTPGSGLISGIYNSDTGTLTLRDSAVIHNGAAENCFGGIFNEGTFTAINSTISNNVSNTIYCYGTALVGYGTVSLRNTTVVDNIGNTDMMGAFGTFTLQNSLIGSCGNTTAMTSLGYNMISSSDCPITAAAGDQFGQVNAPLDLLIGPLQENGGPTLTHALLPQSPAIDAGNPAGCTDQNGNLLTTDQRGVARPQGLACDIGAFELKATGGVKEITIDIKPGSQANPINLRSSGKIPVAILSTFDFNATLEVDRTSLTFGRTGDEVSLVSCNKGGQDVNSDGLLDLVCHFKTILTGFQIGDTVGILKGQTVNDVPIEGQDTVRILK